MASADDFTYKMLSDLCNLNLNDSAVSSLTETLSNYNSHVTSNIMNIMKTSVFAIGASLLTLFMLIELTSLITKANTDNSLRGMQIPINILLKFAILSFLYCHLGTILNGIQEIAVKISLNIAGTSAAVDMGLNTSQILTICEAIEDSDIFEKILIYVFLFVEWLTVEGCLIVINAMVLFRAVELWILLAFAPIPLAAIASNEFRQTCFNYIRNFAAISLQSSVILLCFKIYNLLVDGKITTFDGTDALGFMLEFLTINIGYLIVLVVSVLSAGRMAKSIIST